MKLRGCLSRPQSSENHTLCSRMAILATQYMPILLTLHDMWTSYCAVVEICERYLLSSLEDGSLASIIHNSAYILLHIHINLLRSNTKMCNVMAVRERMMTTIIALGLTWQFTIIIIRAITYDRCVSNVDDTCTTYGCNTDGCIKRRWYNVTLERKSNHWRVDCKYIILYVLCLSSIATHASYR